MDHGKSLWGLAGEPREPPAAGLVLTASLRQGHALFKRSNLRSSNGHVLPRGGSQVQMGGTDVGIDGHRFSAATGKAAVRSEESWKLNVDEQKNTFEDPLSATASDSES